jgi:hypothetical protein
MASFETLATQPGSAEPQQDQTSPIGLLEQVRREGRAWNDLAKQYGVTNPDPPWKIDLEATCDMLAAGSCALPALERRWEEDELAESLYTDVPFPERQLLALAHSMIRRGLVDEQELARRMKQVHERLTMV